MSLPGAFKGTGRASRIPFANLQALSKLLEVPPEELSE